MNRISQIIHLPYAHSQGFLGQGIGIACLDTGITPNHPDFTIPSRRIIGFYDAIYHKEFPYDDNGHGTHVAGILCGSGAASKGRYKGIAPESYLSVIKILNHQGDGYTEDFENCINWLLNNKSRLGIRIINISMVSESGYDFDEDSHFVKQVEKLWDAGLIVVAAAGNGGPRPGSIGAPGNSRKIITVGSSDKASMCAGTGPTRACIKKPDIVAPGSGITSCSLPNRYRFYTQKSGTSMSTPIVSGAIALLLSKYPGMSNLDVKIRLKDTAIDLGRPHEKQGWGMIDVKRLLEG